MRELLLPYELKTRRDLSGIALQIWPTSFPGKDKHFFGLIGILAELWVGK
jgi:hypothetical protein